MFRVFGARNAAILLLAGLAFNLSALAGARAADLLILSESNGNLIRDCSGKDVAVSGSNTKMILTGGCQSLTISGRNNQILAEIAGGGEMTVLRNGNAVLWTKMGEGPNPTIAADRSNTTIEIGLNGPQLTGATPQGESSANNNGQTPKAAAEPVQNGEAVQSSDALPRAKPLASAMVASNLSSKSTAKPLIKAEQKLLARHYRVATIHSQAAKRGRTPLAGSIAFAENSDRIGPKAVRALRQVAIKITGAQRLRVVGHPDAVGPSKYNRSLSKRRAEAVARWLVRHTAVTKHSIQVEAAGFSRTGTAKAFLHHVNIIAKRMIGAHRPDDQNSGSASTTPTAPARGPIDLRDSPASTWNEETIRPEPRSPPGAQKPSGRPSAESEPHDTEQ